MSEIEFIRKYKKVFNISGLSQELGLDWNSFSGHVAGRPSRFIKESDKQAIKTFFLDQVKKDIESIE